MKKFGKAFLISLLLIAGKVYAQPGWSVNPGSYDYSMTMTGVINLNYSEERDVNNMVGAFVGGVCRGVAQPVFDAQVNRYVVYLLVYSNASTETVDFQVYDASTGSTVVIPKTIDFAVNKIEGTSEAPYIWSNPTLSSDADILNYNFAGQLTPTLFDTTSIQVEMPAGTDVTALVATYTTSPYAVVRVNSIIQTTATTANDFTNPVIYNVVSADETTQKNYTVYMSIANGIPSDIAISNTNTLEDAALNTIIGTISSTDIDPLDTHTYSLVSGTGDTDNSLFTISGASLLLNTTLDYETKSSFSIRLRTEDQKGGTFDKVFTITVNDKNDETPQWGGDAVTLLEDISLQNIYTVVATDADLTPAFTVLTYSISAGNSEGKFAIDANTGIVSLINSLDYETTTSFALSITISDGVNTTTGTLTVTLTDVNDETPVFTDVTIQVLESRLVGEQIYQVVATDADDNSTLSYSITNGNAGSAFSIDNSSGAIIVNSLLNFETIPSYNLEISVFDGVNTGVGIITINLVDVNDEVPVVAPATVNISENTTINTVVHALSANDADASSVLIYSIISGNTNSRFTIDAANGVITLVQPLNYESGPVYFLIVGANDGVNTGTAEVKVVIIDENDETPSIPNETVYVSETAPIGTLVKTITATDEDNGSVQTYSIISGNGDAKFALDAVTGVLTLVGNLDYETVSAYLLGIKANDGLNNGIGYITINVQEINDEFPVVSSATVTLSEKSIPMQTVHQVLANDPDNGSVLKYSITSGNTASVFQIDPEIGIIKVIGNLDYETLPSYNLTVIVDDGLHQTTAVININLLNENDETPIVNSDTTSINENIVIGTQVLQINATDTDGLTSLTYSIISGNTGNVFSINANTGAINVAGTIDYESKNQYILTIGVSDGLNTGVADIIFNINDINDEVPVVQSGIIQIEETLSTGTILYSVIASDPDQNTVFNYSITAGNSEGKFQINSSNGKITLLGTLDYETTQSYTLTVSVSDGINSSSAFISIDVMDQNDEIPVPQSATVFVPEDAVLGTLVHTTVATDADNRAVLRYDIYSGNELGKFIINRFTGKINLISALDFETQSSYTLEIIVSDGVNDSIGLIDIIVTDINDFAPTVGDATVNVSENKNVGDTIFVVTPVDTDATSTFSFTLLTGNQNGMFLIGSSSGVISLVGDLDYETQPQYVLSIQVSDGTNITTSTLLILIQNENDELPILNDTSFSVSEFANINDMVGQLIATDRDVTSTITYSLEPSSDEAAFSVNANGKIKVAGYLDYEQKYTYQFAVSVSDGINSNTGMVTVYVTDENETNFKAVNVFTPNNDGVNDFWEIEDAYLYRDCKFVIYNHIGETVFSDTGYNNNWNGTNPNGELLPVGTYYYSVICSNCNDCKTAGFISIVR